MEAVMLWNILVYIICALALILTLLWQKANKTASKRSKARATTVLVASSSMGALSNIIFAILQLLVGQNPLVVGIPLVYAFVFFAYTLVEWEHKNWFKDRYKQMRKTESKVRASKSLRT